MADRLRLCLECAEICEACARVMARGSALTAMWCTFCAEVCDTCAAGLPAVVCAGVGDVLAHAAGTDERVPL